MCYSAQVEHAFKKLIRLTGGTVDYAEIERLLNRRLSDPTIKVARALEANFEAPTNEAEQRIKDSIDQYRARQVPKWELELFTQRKRLADAQRKLATKVTKKAQEEQRIAQSKIQWHVDKLNDMKRSTLNDEDHRIFPFWYAPVVLIKDDVRLITLMRYHCRPAGKPKSIDRQLDGLYNARRDRLENFWRAQFGEHHALIVLNGFYENVDQHRVEGRDLAPGEKALNVVLHFQPTPRSEMFVPCLWSRWSGAGEEDLQSFAIITDDPPEEIAAAGHDRCPINLRADNLDAWLSPRGKNKDDLFRILAEREQPFYEHEVIAA